MRASTLVRALIARTEHRRQSFGLMRSSVTWMQSNRGIETIAKGLRPGERKCQFLLETS